jgi:adenosylhomocysteine nucleosidase
MQIEADGIIALSANAKTQTIAGMDFTTATLNGRDIVIVVCGVGKVNAAMCAFALIDKFSPEVVINSGVAGAVSPLVTIGDLVVATKSVEHDMNTTALGDKQGEVSFPSGTVTYFDCDQKVSSALSKACQNIPDTKVFSGVIASGDLFVSDRSQRLRIHERFDALACEMEGAAIGHVCYSCKVPYAIIRAISDDLDENKGMDFVKFTQLASQKTVTAITNFLSIY